MKSHRPRIITFYSYKGGTGRTMALANIACVLAREASSDGGVLMIDWDFEAPGLPMYFQKKFTNLYGNENYAAEELRSHCGLLDLFCHLDELIRVPQASNRIDEQVIQKIIDDLDLDTYIQETDISGLSLLTAGSQGANYETLVKTFDWNNFFNRSPSLIPKLMNRLGTKFSYILVDSRTGYTDISGICTMLLPEILVLVFTPNWQSLTGVLNLIAPATQYRCESDDLRPMVVFPLPSRIEMGELDLREDWRLGNEKEGIIGYQSQFNHILTKVYDLPPCDLTNYFDEVQIPYIARYAYGEEIAVLKERSSGTLSLSHAYQNFSKWLINSPGPWNESWKPSVEETLKKERSYTDKSPILFISYTHDSPEHEKKVLEFSEQLRTDGIDTRIDEYSPWPEEGWSHWMKKQLHEAEFVLMVFTDTYCRRITGEEEAGIGKGVCWEAKLIYNDLYVNKLYISKYIPVLFKGGKCKHIPPVLRGHTVFAVDSQEGYEDLYRRLTNQPKVKVGPLGKLKKFSGLKSLIPSNPLVKGTAETPPKNILSFFVSYVHGDLNEENLARFLHTNFVAAGHESFIDISISFGTNWVAEIKNRISWCDCLVVLLSENSMQSEMVRTEIRLAHLEKSQTGKPKIIPIRVGYFGPLEYEMHLCIGQLQYFEWSKPQQSDQLFEDIINAAHIEGDHEPVALGERLRSRSVPKPISDNSPPQPFLDTRSASIPGGTVSYDDPYYINRTGDDVVVDLASNFGKTLVIKGPRQMGKSSVLLHYLSKCQNEGKKIAFVDFQIFSSEDFSSYTTFLSRLAWVLQHRLKIDADPPSIDSQFEMGQFIEQKIFNVINSPIVIAFDEADRLFSQTYRADFYTMLRTWHNSRSPLTPVYDNLDLALVISTEPYLLINEADRSPFNVGRTIEMEPFTLDHYFELNRFYQDLLSSAEVKELWDLLQGQPYLTRLAYYRLVAPDKCTFRNLIENADDERGPFGDHLRSLLINLHGNSKLLSGMKKVIHNGSLPDQDTYYRLYGAGLIRHEQHRVNPANLLYARFFRDAL